MIMKKLTFLAAIVSLLVLVSCGGGGIGGNTPASLTKEMNDMMKKGDYEKAMHFWFDNSATDKLPSQMAAADKKELDDMLKAFGDKAKEQYDKKGGIASIEVTKEEIDDEAGTAKVTSQITLGDGSSDDSTSNFVKVDGKWKFDNSVGK